MNRLPQSLAVLLLGAVLGVGGSSLADDTASKIRSLLGDVKVTRIDIQTERGLADIHFTAEPTPEAKALGVQPRGWQEHAFCPSEAVQALVTACSQRDTRERPAVMFAEGQGPTELDCSGDAGCVAVPVVQQ